MRPVCTADLAMWLIPQLRKPTHEWLDHDVESLVHVAMAHSLLVRRMYSTSNSQDGCTRHVLAHNAAVTNKYTAFCEVYS